MENRTPRETDVPRSRRDVVTQVGFPHGRNDHNVKKNFFSLFKVSFSTRNSFSALAALKKVFLVLSHKQQIAISEGRSISKT